MNNSSKSEEIFKLQQETPIATMKLFSLTTILYGLSSLSVTLAAKSFSGSNLYYAAGLTDSQSTSLLSGLKSAGVKVLRVWLDGIVSPPHRS